MIVAPNATGSVVFALANKNVMAQIGGAFQASSPKTSMPGWLVQPGFFFVFARALRNISRTRARLSLIATPCGPSHVVARQA